MYKRRRFHFKEKTLRHKQCEEISGIALKGLLSKHEAILGCSEAIKTDSNPEFYEKSC